MVGSTNLEMILSGIEQNTSPNNWLKDFDKEALKQVAQFTKFFSQYLKDESKRYDLLYKDRSNNFKDDVQSLIEVLLQQDE